jgi:hypothetical protein
MVKKSRRPATALHLAGRNQKEPSVSDDTGMEETSEDAATGREAWIAGTKMGGHSGCSASNRQHRTQIRSGCFSIVVSKLTTQSFPAFNFSGRPPHRRLRRNQSVADPLVVSLSMKIYGVKRRLDRFNC